MANSPSVLVPRRAVELSSESNRTPQLLSSWRNAGAYILLAEPGAGKTEAFKAEAERTNGYVTASDFITLRSRAFDKSTPIFIDGLDEIRAGSGSSREPLDEIRRRLDELGRPPFRLSCREADWRGAVDLERLKAVAPGGTLAELHLQELSDTDILKIVRGFSVERPNEFLEESELHGVRPLLANPLLLGLIVKAIQKQGNDWPDDRSTIYSMACRQLALEYNKEHLAERRRKRVSIDILLKDAGLTCALLLLAGIRGIPDAADVDNESLPLEDELPSVLGIEDPRAALASKLFLNEGGLRVPRHRTIAEFLAAGAIAERIEGGLPIGRVLALMSGADGGIVDPLRGLHAWLAVHCISERSVLIGHDPLGIVLYGDIKSFSTVEKRQVLNALHREAQRYAWFRKGHWADDPFGALGTADMTDTFRDLLTSSDRSTAHQSLLGCVFDAIKNGEAMPGIKSGLEAVVRDPSYLADIRSDALDALFARPEIDFSDARILLDQIEAGTISDPNDQLAGGLLRVLYPKYLTPKEVAVYFRSPKSEYFSGRYREFWRHQFVTNTPPEHLGDVLDAWVDSGREIKGDRHGFVRNHVTGALLAATLTACGDNVPVDRLYKWLGVGLGKRGVSRLSGDDVKDAQQWLSQRPSKLKALVAYGWTLIPADAASERHHFWQSEERTLRATRPADWYAWLLDYAAATNDKELARYCFNDAAYLALNPRPGFELTMEMVEDWVHLNRGKWPKANEWLEAAWSTLLDPDNWQREEIIRKRADDAKREIDRRERRRNILPHLASIFSGTAPAGLMNQIALAYDKRYYDLHGETPIELVQDFLGGTVEEAKLAIKGFEATLARSDLPDVDDILKTDLAGRSHYIRPACLLGAALAFQSDPKSTLGWPDNLVRKLAAFWLTEGTGEQPDWFPSVAVLRPAIVAPVLEQYAVQSIRRRSMTGVTGLWLLARDDRFAKLSRFVVPAILRAFPIRANERQLRTLNVELLPAAIKHHSPEELAIILAERMALKSLDAAQRIAYLVAGLGIDGEAYSQRLLALVGASESRAAHLGRALEWQEARTKGANSVSAPVAGRLIELIAPYAPPERPTGAYTVGDADHRREWTYHFISQLASDASTDAAKEISRLSASRSLARWKLALDGAAFDQTRALRDATFRQASVLEVANVLANKAPANPRDLAALLLDHLRDLESRLHGDDTNGLRLFRRDDGRTPKTENECRDILLDRMRPRLRALGGHLEKEGQATQDTRADMRAEFMQPGYRLVVPIEIKKEDHRAVWSAWRTQLHSYALDPASDGTGIYLVLWFGDKATATPEGIRPSTPQQLRELLSAMIPEKDRCRIHVVVLDLSQAK